MSLSDRIKPISYLKAHAASSLWYTCECSSPTTAPSDDVPPSQHSLTHLLVATPRVSLPPSPLAWSPTQFPASTRHSTHTPHTLSHRTTPRRTGRARPSHPEFPLQNARF